MPALEPKVAQVLDTGFAAQLGAKAGAVAVQQAEAVAEHDKMAAGAQDGYRRGLAAEQNDVDQRAARLQGGTAKKVGAEKSAWTTEATAAITSAQAEVQQAQGATVADVQERAGQANSEAAQTLTAAEKDARKADPGEQGVQRSFWGNVKKKAGGALRSVRNGIAALGAAARGILDRALNKVRTMFDAVRKAIADRVRRYAEAVARIAAKVRDKVVAAAKRALQRVRDVVRAARAVLDRLGAALRAFAVRALNRLRGALRRAGAWLAAKAKALVGALVRAGKFVLSLAGKVKEFLKVTGSKVLGGAAKAIENPRAFVAPYKAKVGAMVDAAPAKAKEMYDAHAAPLLDGKGSGTSKVAAGPSVQRQEVGGGPEQVPSHGSIVWEYLKDRLSHLKSNWGSVILDVLVEIFVPFVSLYRHLPPMLKAVWQGLKDLFAGRFSDAVDQGLKAARELMAILSTLFAQFSIVAFIVGSIVGTPIVGEAAMVAVGLGLLGADVVVQGLSIAKAWSNLSRPDRTVEQLNEDYSNIADSIMGLGVTLALIVIAAIGQKLGKAFLARFPRAASALESIRARVRKRLGIKHPKPTGPVVDEPKAPPKAPEATAFPGRAGLSAGEQKAFDRFILDRRAAGKMTPEFEAKLKAASADDLRKICKKEFAAQADVEAKQAAEERAKDTNASDVLEPKFANSRDEGGGVRSHWNETPPSAAEIRQAKGIAAQTGEPVELFGDAFRGIDGTVGKPPRPLQLKGIPAAKGPAEVHRSAQEAFKKANKHGFRDVEVHITAEGMTKAQVAAEFAKPTVPGQFMGGPAVRRVVVWCTDGAFVPTGRPSITPIHVDEDELKDKGAKVPASAPGGGG